MCQRRRRQHCRQLQKKPQEYLGGSSSNVCAVKLQLISKQIGLSGQRADHLIGHFSRLPAESRQTAGAAAAAAAAIDDDGAECRRPPVNFAARRQSSAGRALVAGGNCAHAHHTFELRWPFSGKRRAGAWLAGRSAATAANQNSTASARSTLTRRH